MRLIKKYVTTQEGKTYTNFYLCYNGVYIAIKPAFIKDLGALKVISEEDDA